MKRKQLNFRNKCSFRKYFLFPFVVSVAFRSKVIWECCCFLLPSLLRKSSTNVHQLDLFLCFYFCAFLLCVSTFFWFYFFFFLKCLKYLGLLLDKRCWNGERFCFSFILFFFPFNIVHNFLLSHTLFAIDKGFCFFCGSNFLQGTLKVS